MKDLSTPFSVLTPFSVPSSTIIRNITVEQVVNSLVFRFNYIGWPPVRLIRRVLVLLPFDVTFSDRVHV